MGFEALLGNDRLKENLRAALTQGRVSHFYLISGPEGSGKKTLAKLLAAALVCAGENRPCGNCPACRKALGGNHPDVITVDDPEKKTVPVELIRQARADIYVRPNEAERKVYILPRGQDMMEPSQNALLKVLEEPPAYGVFLLLTDNPERLLPTIRSRCTELSMQALSDELVEKALRERFPEAGGEEICAAVERCAGYLGQGIAALEEGSSISPQMETFAASYAARDTIGLLQVLTGMEKWKRDALVEELQQWKSLLQAALLSRSGGTTVSKLARTIGERRDSRQLLRAIRTLETVIGYTQYNVSAAAICGYLRWALQ